MTATMTAMLSEAPGGPETLTATRLPLPDPKKGEVRIAIRAAGVNYPDTLIIRDLYQMKPPRPFAPGAEISGIVEAAGEGVTRFAPGDRVIAMPGVGGFATHICIAESLCMKMPEDMSFEEAAALTLTYGTSYYALKDRAGLTAGETLFILGAAGGVGAAAIELGKAIGARVIAGVSSQEKAVFCRDLGADETLVYPREMAGREAQKALSGALRELAGAGGIDVAYDAVGGNYAEPVLRVMAWEGRYLVVGFPAGIPEIPLNLVLLKSSQIVGVFWGAGVQRNPAGHATNMADLFRLYAEGKIRPRVSATFPLEQAADALTALEARTVMGKVVLVPGEG